MSEIGIMVSQMKKVPLLRTLERLLPVQSIYSPLRQISSTAQRLSDTKKNAYYESNRRPDIMAKDDSTPQTGKQVKPEKAKTVSQADEELRQKLEQMSGGGGAAGIEYEDGKPSAMKRSVRNNMFRYI
ncbi:hypothetical protein BDV27DRAFT_152450 [Aspergillus caelatus]|uniref:Uncharacterized protein n=2 Tax=Aspergillus subgen. Circumdati TaxID=2720871 RepID=A0A5N7AK05_9EURO|nr:uncharacterized protein BDV27DRAFT_152450 [Aspergillus caelatus]KAE8370033.1 hypothetical protein BDV27DRAFT_152450 [Aspergillus caelatus]KAE8422074.1 hypothetical protein BDV36DRAFT_291591 [Aspergillus pseudocaelatus]